MFGSSFHPISPRKVLFVQFLNELYLMWQGIPKPHRGCLRVPILLSDLCGFSMAGFSPWLPIYSQLVCVYMAACEWMILFVAYLSNRLKKHPIYMSCNSLKSLASHRLVMLMFCTIPSPYIVWHNHSMYSVNPCSLVINESTKTLVDCCPCHKPRTFIASSPGPFEKLEKRAWYPLFVHALNFLTFREFRIIPCYLRVPWTSGTRILLYI